jgi:hypothetical protein
VAFGVVVEHAGARGVTLVHAALGLAAAVVWGTRSAAKVVAWMAGSDAKAPGGAPPARHGSGR